jgi:hypothetical protein
MNEVLRAASASYGAVESSVFYGLFPRRSGALTPP